MNGYIAYSKYSDTIRQQPENYCIAIKYNDRWVIDADSAADLSMVIRVLQRIMKFGSCSNVKTLIEQIN